MKKVLRIGLGLVAVVVVGIQFVPVERTNPPVQSDIEAPAEVKAVLKRACYDCHSHETAWPWYSRVAPVSWWVADHVRHARGEFNFSTWERYDERERVSLLKEAWHEVEEGEMPLPNYLPMHPEARLSEEDRAVLRDWIVSVTEGSPDDEADDG